MSSSIVSTSILSKHLQPLSELQQSKVSKTGTARVLTSTECLEALEEKRKKKAELEQEKEARKVERERKKKEREDEAKRKKEQRKEREELAKKKREEKAKEKERRAQEKRETAAAKRGKKSSRSTRGSSSATSDPLTTRDLPTLTTPPTAVSNVPTSAVSEPCTSASITGVPPCALASESMVLSEEESSECAFCFESYCEDGREWVKCACQKWVHEDCVEEIVYDLEGKERFCPFCINT